MISMRIRRGEDVPRKVWMELPSAVKWALVASGVREPGEVTLGMLRTK